jgi:rhamnose transport system permease protein
MFERHRREFSLVIAILALGAVLAVVAPGFFTFANQRDLVLANMPVLIVALGMVLVILTGQIDISVGSQFAICSVATGVFARMGMPTPLAGFAACVLGALMGALNGALVAWVRIPAIVVTLATMVALRDGLRMGGKPAAGISMVRTIADRERSDHDWMRTGIDGGSELGAT